MQPWASRQSNVPENRAKSPAAEGPLRERPLPRLLQQLSRKKFTGRLVLTDQTQDESEVYMRDGWLVHVGRPVETDRLDNLLIEYGLVSPEVVAQASQQVTPGTRLGEVLDRMGALDKSKLAQVLKSQLLRKLTRVFFVAEGRYAAYLGAHDYGVGADLALMRVDYRTVIYPGIRAAYDLSRVTQELSRLTGQRFRLAGVSPGFIAALGMQEQDSVVDALGKVWLTLDDLDAITARPFEVRAVVLALYYCDLLEHEPLAEARSDALGPRVVQHSWSPDMGAGFNLPDPPGTPAPSEPAGQGAPPLGVFSPLPKPSPVSPGAAPGARPGAAAPTVPPPDPAGSTSPPSQVRPNVPGETVRAIPASLRPPGAQASPVPPTSATGRGPVATAGRPPIVRGPVVPVPSEVKAPSGTAAGEPSLRTAIQEMAHKLDRVDHFEALGVSRTASADEVSLAFVRAARRFHPDRLASAGLLDLQPVAERILARINEAAMVLGNAARRADYVASLAAGPQAASASLPTVLEAENAFLKGEVFLKKGEHGKAIECFTAATQGNPGEPQYRAYLAWARFDDPRARKESVVRETLRVMQAVAQERPRFARGHYWTGLLWKFLDELGRAEHAFREAVAVDSGFIDASRELRLIEMRKNKSAAGKPSSKPEPPHGGFMGKLFKK
jgi:hypothetical protein